uniref:Uncharacterized protein n=1 Tax=Anguilla anguilla TaxID=7936 RepID=A0A0E9WEC7_ANGAN
MDAPVAKTTVALAGDGLNCQK